MLKQFRGLSRVGTIVLILFATATYAAAEPGPAITDAVAATKTGIQPIGPSEVTAARAGVDSAVTGLDGWLKAHPALAAAWKRYLHWDEMQSQLAAGNDAKASDLRTVALQYFADHPGLELPPFRTLGNALRNYANVLYASREDDFKQEYEAKADEVVDLLAKYQSEPTEANASNVASHLKWLARYGKPAQLLSAIRTAYGKPNFFLQVDEELIVHGVRRDLNEITPIHDMIMGTSINGTGRTIGRLDAELQPNADRAVLELRLRGTTYSRTVGSNRSALIYSTGSTTISGFKRLTIDENGITTTPSTADAKTNSKITGIGSTRGGIGGCLVVKIASKKAAESKGQATAIGSQHAEARIRERLDAEAAKQLEVSNRDLRVKFREPLKRVGTYPASIKFNSTNDDLFVTGLEANWTQLGAPNDPPAMSGEHALVVVAHESAVNNAGNTMFSGRTIHDYEIRNEIIRRRGSLPDDMKDDEDRDPWSISFIDEQPIHFQIADGGFHVLLKFREFTSGERALKGVNVSAKYKAERDGTRLVLVRQGDLVVVRDGAPENARIPIGEVALRSVLRKKFSKLFKERIEGEGLEMPGKYKSLGKLPVGDYLMESGWAAIGWDMPNAKVARID